MTRRGDETDVISRISFSTRHATTERIFLIIDNFRIFHLNNLIFSVKLLYTHMNNFPTGSFLSVKLTQTLFVAKVRKKLTMARIDFLLNIYKQSTIFFKALIGLNSIVYVCPKNFKSFPATEIPYPVTAFNLKLVVHLLKLFPVEIGKIRRLFGCKNNGQVDRLTERSLIKFLK